MKRREHVKDVYGNFSIICCDYILIVRLLSSLYNSSSDLLTFFDGSGYSNITRENQLQDDPKIINLSFDINTFDENALIFVIPQSASITMVSRTLNIKV